MYFSPAYILSLSQQRPAPRCIYYVSKSVPRGIILSIKLIEVTSETSFKLWSVYNTIKGFERVLEVCCCLQFSVLNAHVRYNLLFVYSQAVSISGSGALGLPLRQWNFKRWDQLSMRFLALSEKLCDPERSVTH